MDKTYVVKITFQAENQIQETMHYITSASALVYSISETAKLNILRPYYYFKYILTGLPKLCDGKGNIYPAKLDYLMPGQILFWKNVGNHAAHKSGVKFNGGRMI